MWLSAMRAERLLVKNGLTRAEIARLFGYSLAHINEVMDGRFEAGEDLARQLQMLGARLIAYAIDWRRTRYAG